MCAIIIGVLNLNITARFSDHQRNTCTGTYTVGCSIRFRYQLKCTVYIISSQKCIFDVKNKLEPSCTSKFSAVLWYLLVLIRCFFVSGEWGVDPCGMRCGTGVWRRLHPLLLMFDIFESVSFRLRWVRSWSVWHEVWHAGLEETASSVSCGTKVWRRPPVCTLESGTWRGCSVFLNLFTPWWNVDHRRWRKHPSTR